MYFRLKNAVNTPVARAALWTTVGFALGQLLRLANNLLLTRLIQPEAFGVMAIVTVVIVGIEMTTDLGINTSIVQNKNGDQPEFVSTAWTIKIIRGFIMAVLIAILAVPLAEFYNEPALYPLLLAVAAITAVGGLASNSISIAARRLWLGRQTAIGLIAQVMAMIVSAAWAMQWPNASALVAGLAANTLTITLSTFLAYPEFRHKISWNSDSAREIYSFGKWIFLTSILIFAAGQIDRIVLPKLVSLHEFGLYSIALMWAILPVTVAQIACSRLIFPIAAEELRSTVPNRLRLLRHRRRIVVLGAVLTLILYGAFDTLFKHLYTEEYWPAIKFFEILLIGNVMRIADESYRVFNLAAGTPQYTTVGNFLALILFLASVFPLYHFWGSTAVVFSYAFAQSGSLVSSFAGAWRHDLRDGAFDVVTLASAAFVAFLINQFLGWIG